MVSNLEGDVTGDVTGDVSGSSGSTTGNAATATALATARTIGGTSFDGTANIAVGLADTATALATARTIGGTSFDGTTNIVPATATLATTVTVTDSAVNTNFPVVFHNESNGLLDDTGALRYNPSTGELLVPNLTVAGTSTVVDTVTMNAQNAIIFEGATADAHETTLSIVDPTADHTQYLINQSGYIPVLAASTTTAITSTPAELNTLDALSRGSIIYGNSSGVTTVLPPGSNEQVLVSDGTDIAWANNTGAGAENLGDLNDVSTTGEANGKILKHNGSSWAVADDAGGMSDIVEDLSPQLGGDLDVQDSEITTNTSNGNIIVTPNGSGVFEVKGAGGSDGTMQLNCSSNTHGVKIKSPPHSAAASYTLILPNTVGTADQILQTNGTGTLSWTDATSGDATQTLTDAATVTWNMANGNIGLWTIGGNRTLQAPTNAVVGTSVIRLTQDATGSRTVTWPANFKWSAGSAPVLSTAAAAIDILSFIYDGTNFYGSLVSRGAA